MSVFSAGSRDGCRGKASLLITSSPAFVENYFDQISSVRSPVLLIENKVFTGDGTVSVPVRGGVSAKPWQIGWFGAIRCARSFALLSRLTRSFGGEIEVVIRGRPTARYLRFREPRRERALHAVRRSLPQSDDLAKIYGEVDFAWAIDFFEEGQNSEWLLPNRLYEKGVERCDSSRARAYGDGSLAGLEGCRRQVGRSAGSVSQRLLPGAEGRGSGRSSASDCGARSGDVALPSEECSALVTRMARPAAREPVVDVDDFPIGRSDRAGMACPCCAVQHGSNRTARTTALRFRQHCSERRRPNGCRSRRNRSAV